MYVPDIQNSDIFKECLLLYIMLRCGVTGLVIIML